MPASGERPLDFSERAEHRDRFRPPNELFLGTSEGAFQSGVLAFCQEADAVRWLQDKSKGPRHAWKVHLDEMTEMVLTPPVAPKLVVKE